MTEYVTTSYDVNGEPMTVAHPPHHTLLEVLREGCDLTGTKHGCELGECGACAVLVDGEPQLSCLVLALDVSGARVETVVGLAGADGLHPLQHAFADLGAAQCGYCTPGVVMSVFEACYRRDIDDDGALDDQMCGNLCRCTGYRPIRDAARAVAGSCPEDRFSRWLNESTGSVEALEYQVGAQRYV